MKQRKPLEGPTSPPDTLPLLSEPPTPMGPSKALPDPRAALVDDGKRTARDFVRDMCIRGRTDQQIRAVAFVTQWGRHLDEVTDWLTRRGDRWREKGATEC